MPLRDGAHLAGRSSASCKESWEEHLAIIGTVSGMTVMAVSLWPLAGQDSPLAKLPEGIPS